MHIVLGGTGHVGSALVETLLARGEPVTLVTRDASKAAPWRAKGAQVEEADILDTAALRRVFRLGRRAFLLNPSADPSGDSDAAERRTIGAILAALEGSDLEKVVAQSTYGAQPGESIGDLGSLHVLEQGLKAQPIPATILRAAYYLSNWDMQLDLARQEGTLTSFFPADFALPMVAPRDLGEAVADFLTEPVGRTGVRHVEGPRHYTPRDVADAMAAVVGRPVELQVVPRGQWRSTFERLGFSEAAARSYARMTEITLDGGCEQPESPRRGSTTLRAYFEEVARRSSK